MITFKEYLTEARMAPLYHGTSFRSAERILENNKIIAGTYHIHNRTVKNSSNHFIDVVSLTRSFKFANNWAKRKSYIGEYIIFELDQQKLAQKYKIVPYNHFQDDLYNDRPGTARELHDVRRGRDEFPINQYEENVIGDIKNAKSYITKIYYVDERDKESLKLLAGNIPFEKIYNINSPKGKS